MNAFDWHRIFFEELPLAFLGEVALRVLVAYLLVFLFLKIAGRRGIRQLSVFKLIVILTLGSAAGDVTFYEDVPIAPVAMVFAVLLVLYRVTTYVMGCSKRFAIWMDGAPVTLIRNGRYEVDNLAKLNISEDEFFMELRQQSVEHLGQVRIGILETDGDLSLFFYEDKLVQPGLSVMPPEHREDYCQVPDDGLYACNHCGHTQMLNAQDERTCSHCEHESWSIALTCRRTN